MRGIQTCNPSTNSQNSLLTSEPFLRMQEPRRSASESPLTPGPNSRSTSRRREKEESCYPETRLRTRRYFQVWNSSASPTSLQCRARTESKHIEPGGRGQDIG